MAKKAARKENTDTIEAPLDLIINTTLLIVAFTVFGLIITVNNELFKANKFLALQLVLSIPFITASSMARVRIASTVASRNLTEFAWATFVLGYAFLINSVGILLAGVVSLPLAITFLIGNIIIALFYSAVLTVDKRVTVQRRMIKDGLFVFLVILLGIIPVLQA